MRRGRRSGLQIPSMGLPALALVLLALAGCGDEGSDADPAATPLELVQTARSGSFLRRGGEIELVLRGVGGTTSIGGGGAVATSKLFRDPESLLGPLPVSAVLGGAEVNPVGYELELSDPEYDGRLLSITWTVEGIDGEPVPEPASFGAASLVLSPPAEPASLSGSVASLEGGEPLSGALVTARLGGLGLFTAITDANGGFTLVPVPAGEWELEASADGYERSATTVDASEGGSGSADFELAPIPGEAPLDPG